MLTHRLCPQCGNPLWETWQMCPHHGNSMALGWGLGNKLACDFFHRGIVPPAERMTEWERLYMLGLYPVWR